MTWKGKNTRLRLEFKKFRRVHPHLKIRDMVLTVNQMDFWTELLAMPIPIEIRWWFSFCMTSDVDQALDVPVLEVEASLAHRNDGFICEDKQSLR